jgi:hypothetical protein
MAATALMPAPSGTMPTSPTSERPDTPEPAGHSSFIIFDWDDTLLSSTWLAQHGIRLDEPLVIPEEVRAHLEALQGSVVKLLDRAVTLGTVCIITNAETGWVELSARRFMPAVLPLLSKVRVLSARSTFEPECSCPSEWKVRAFSQELHVHYSKEDPTVTRNVLSFGDSIHERHAVHKVTAGVPNMRTKSIKFVERPTAEQLRRQVDLVHGCISDVVGHRGDLDLMLTIQLLYK